VVNPDRLRLPEKILSAKLFEEELSESHPTRANPPVTAFCGKESRVNAGFSALLP